MPAMASTSARWNRASTVVTTADGRRTPELVQLPPGVPALDALFAFARDAEHRFSTLRLRLEEHAATSAGTVLRVHEVLLAHPGRARVTTIRPDRPTPESHEIWLSDGEVVRIYRSSHRLTTSRPPRPRLAGIQDGDLPGTSRPYVPLTALPANTLAETFVHPAGFCQNVLATGAARVTGTGTIAGREVIHVAADHPRTVELAGDRPDHRLEAAFDRETGLLALLVEAFGDTVTRHAEAVELTPDASIPDSAFTVAIPGDASLIY
jgi:hypothetical protein